MFCVYVAVLCKRLTHDTLFHSGMCYKSKVALPVWKGQCVRVICAHRDAILARVLEQDDNTA